MKGYIHSIETMGLVDGPGIRSVVFLSGCPLRCLYCHNPDTWKKEGMQMEAEALVKKLVRFRSYYEHSGGGVTISGGEPLCQAGFVEEIFKLLKKEGIHTCLDTAGAVSGDFKGVLENTDLVLYDVKHYTNQGYKKVTGKEIETTLDFVRQLRESNVAMWVRHVVVPGITDGKEHLEGLRDYIDILPNVENVELLAFHKMGAYKYKELGIKDPLEDTHEMSTEKCKELEKVYFGKYRKETKSA